MLKVCDFVMEQVYSRRQATLHAVVDMVTGGRSKAEVLVGFGNQGVIGKGPISRG